ncbi:DUF2066 domain-containing protein [Zavarzinia compransoris]|uniref:DUF2066 domain-containing protein n=1 Tax=Zavarzinia compransoris TaxID=1264899 RepID=A0A317E0N9_9PROT|nr:DUF2066 domain-containing protein [Zavarzinia compransoris]PWR20618.1 DUF2066 domain-containing protein [Zavarzinia compransoris]TDP44566.1 hypothetical protein DES42_107334 [Zavarzinia compransoris]
MRILAFLLGVAAALVPDAGRARVVERLTACETVVTGQGEAERARGLGVCLAEVLVRVAGRPDLADDPRLPALQARAAEAIVSLEYEDRMKGLPLGDEQGTRDRPFFLRPTFSPGAIDGMLAALGRRPWPADRPVLGVVVVSRRDGRDWLVSRGGPGVTRGAQVEALDAAAARFGLPLVLPDAAAAPDGSAPDSVAAGLAADTVLTGDLVWDEAATGWRVTWTLAGQAPWSLAGVSFDDAFRAGIGGAAGILSRRP